jgi:formate dehydrogenase
MTPHTSGSSLSAQARYAAGTREILECHFEGKPIREEYLIVEAGQARRSRSPLIQREGSATEGSEEAARFSR